MRKLLLAIIIVFFVSGVKAQQDPQVSQNMFNLLSINPAYAGMEKSMIVSALNRQQWVGFDGAPVTTYVNFSMPLTLGNTNHGLGLSIIRDELGMEKNTGVRFSYAYEHQLGNGALYFGINLGVQNNALSGKWFVPQGDGFTNINADLGSASIDEGSTIFDTGLGVFYKNDKFYGGLSISHVTQPSVKYSNNVEVKLARHYYLTAGYTITIDDKWEMIPSVFYKTDAVVSQIDVNSLIQYNEKLWAGVSYRLDDAIVAMIGVLFNNGIQVGYAYDISTSRIAKGSHEFFLAYRFNTKIEKRKQKYKSIRFM